MLNMPIEERRTCKRYLDVVREDMTKVGGIEHIVAKRYRRYNKRNTDIMSKLHEY